MNFLTTDEHRQTQMKITPVIPADAGIQYATLSAEFFCENVT